MKKYFLLPALCVCLFGFETSPLCFAQNVDIIDERAKEKTVEKQTAFRLSSFYVGYLYPVPIGNQWKLIDIEGNIVGETVYDGYVHPFDKSLRYAYVLKDGKCYRIVSSGKTTTIEIPKGYNLIADVGQGVVILESDRTKDVNNQYAYNILTNKFIGQGFASAHIAGNGDNLLPISIWNSEIENSNLTISDLTVNVLDLVTGKRILASDEKREGIIGISEGIVNIGMGNYPNRYTYLVDRNNKQLLLRHGERLSVGLYKNGVAVVKFQDEQPIKVYLIDRSGNILSPTYKVISDNSSGLSRVVPGEGNLISQGHDFYGFVNTLGNNIIPAQYIDASHFRDGMALVQKRDDMGVYLINSFGDELYQLQGIPERMSLSFLERLWQSGVFIVEREEDIHHMFQLFNIDGNLIYETLLCRKTSINPNGIPTIRLYE
ncbi:MAG: WG repeat-containing protein [Planctomycetaceae bacterium]|nr:WG repeat-containing protein [Planctomycetaceae bacterium]